MARSTKATRQAQQDAAYTARKCERCGHENGWHSVDLEIVPAPPGQLVPAFRAVAETCKYEGCDCSIPLA
jgi:hypothetical protein